MLWHMRTVSTLLLPIPIPITPESVVTDAREWS